MISYKTYTLSAKHISQLEGLGFTRSDCEVALEASSGRLEDAAVWLTQNATPAQVKSADGGSSGTKSMVSGFEVSYLILLTYLPQVCKDYKDSFYQMIHLYK